MRRGQVDPRPTAEHMFNRDYNNYKPYRTRRGKLENCRRAKRAEDGSWHSDVMNKLFHPVRRELLPIKSRYTKLVMSGGQIKIERR